MLPSGEAAGGAERYISAGRRVGRVSFEFSLSAWTVGVLVPETEVAEQ